jgi:signal transduction histidine kinase
MHKGRIEVQDSELGGARFEVTIPKHAGAVVGAVEKEARLDLTTLDGILEELRSPGPALRRDATVTGGRPRVLVVEDNRDMNDFVAQCLRREYDVISAFDGGEGLALALESRPAVIVSDIMMPKVSGVEMIAAIRKRPELEHVPIVLLSAKADEGLMVELLGDGAQDFIVKPFSEKELLVRVRNLVRVEQAREEVVALRETAESANRAKDQFLAMLGHELRNPLSPILTALQVMKLRGSPGAERERAVIERQVNHLTRLVDDLLDVSRIARGMIELKLAPVEMAEVVSKAIEMASPLYEQRKHRLAVDVMPHGLAVHGDAIRLSQIVSNLLMNAAKYTPSGGNITVGAARVGDEVELFVRDDGIGIAQDILPRVFELFVQAEQELDRPQGGLGIGLSIVKNLVERHGGSVSATSEGLGKGSQFVIRLPTAPTLAARCSDGARAEAAPPATRATGNDPRVLIVDDNEDGAEIMVDAVTSMGYEARLAYDAPAALRVAAEFLPAIAFLDIGLPVMNGYELAARLREIPGLSQIRLIAVTGYGQESDRAKARAAGFHHHLVKPIDLDQIAALLRNDSRESSLS